MDFDWNKIGKKVSKFYEKMEYDKSDYNDAQFLNDLKTEMMKKEEISDELSGFETDFHRIQMLKNSLDKHRSILTKFFSLTNNPNGVDMLIEYCDYYLPHCFHSKEIRYYSPFDWLMFTIHLAFLTMAKNGTTKDVDLDIWKMFWKNIAWPSKHLRRYTFDRLDCEYPYLAMVIMADSDLNATVQAFIGSYNTNCQVKRVLVQEPIMEQLLNTIRNEEFKDRILSDLFVFRNTEEALGNLNGNEEFEALSIWSENIIAAKKFAANAQIHTIWINALGLFDFGLHSMHNFLLNVPSRLDNTLLMGSSHQSSLTCKKVAKKYDLFYGGKWQNPDNGKYRTHKTGDSIAEATEKDFENCAEAAREAFKVWRSTKLSQRVKVMRCFAERLQANGESKYAGIVLKYLHRPLDFGTSLSIVRDGEAEILTTPEPVGVIAIRSKPQKMLFAQLTIASVTGNAVAVVLNHESYMSFAPYCDLLGTCGFPPGLISCIFATDELLDEDERFADHFDRVPPEPSEDPNETLLDPYKHRRTRNTLYNTTFIHVTTPKSVWIPIH